MQLTHLILMVMAMLLASLLAAPLSNLLRLPFSAMLVLLGFAGVKLLVVVFGVDTGLDWSHFHDLVFYLLLPVLIFEAALNMSGKTLWQNIVPVFILAVPLMMVSAAIAAVILYVAFDHPEGFPVLAALLTAVILSATDPAAVLDLFKKAGVPERLAVLVDGESLFNDATAVVFFSMVLAMALNDGSDLTAASVVTRFCWVFFGGLLTGSIVGVVCTLLLRLLADRYVQSVLSVLCAYGAYLLAEKVFHVSGVMSVLAAGLVFGWACREVKGARENGFIGDLWGLNAFVANACLFLLVGVTVELAMFETQWLGMLIGIGAVLVARAVIVFLGTPLTTLLPGVDRISGAYQTVMFWGGIRGGVSVALALSLPLSLSWWYEVQSVAYGVVLFTLFVQAPTMPLLLRKLKL